MKDFQRKKQFNLYHLQAKTELKNLADIFMKADDFILEIRLTWKDLNNWQKYQLSNPVKKDFPAELFQFQTSGFQVVDRFFF